MEFLNPIFRGVSIENPPYLSVKSLWGKVFFFGLPAMTVVLIAIFFIAGKCVEDIVDRAITRNSQMLVRATGFALERMLMDARDELLLLAAGPLQENDMERWMRSRVNASGTNIREVAFMAYAPEDRYILLNHGGGIISVPGHASRDAQGAPLREADPPQPHQAGLVSLSSPMEISYPMVMVDNSPLNMAYHVLRFSIPIYGDGNNFKGILSLSLDLGAMRDQMSLFSRMEGHQAHSFFFDEDGWMLFQSENDPSKDKPLGSDMARAGFRGDFGRPGFSRAFRPAPEHLNYWTVVSDVQNGRHGLLRESVASTSEHPDHLLPRGVSYAPVTFLPGPDAKPRIVGGVALVDDALAATSPGQLLWHSLALAFFGVFLALALFLWSLTRVISRQALVLGRQLEERVAQGSTKNLPASPLPLEFERLREGINRLLGRLASSEAASESTAAARTRQWRRRAARDMPKTARLYASSLVGESPAMRALYAQIDKAAQVNADVLVVGETGTGKELVASAIHRHSPRASGPFISINCGALDEALLMDTLFGHVKGAFTEAKSDRKGAFLAAGGGTLLLDEIGNATPRVQQALLRALSTRYIRPLGSDVDLPFDTRIIAATNAPLRGDDNGFRADLYYRLAVITIETPPLREHKDDIPALIVHFIAQTMGQSASGADLPAISHGALEKLSRHDWPGNVRELRNIITRALAFCDGKLVMAEDLRLENQGKLPTDSGENNQAQDNGACNGQPQAILDQLNPRQRAFLAALVARGSLSRQDYQEIAGMKISSRTAQYDLKFMVELGLLKPEGRGPGTRYTAIFPPRDSEAGNPAASEGRA